MNLWTTGAGITPIFKKRGISKMEFSKKFVSEDLERSTFLKHVAAPIFRKSFNVTGDIKRAEILICGLGFYDLFINGKKITKGFLAPYVSNPDHIIYYDKYDLAPYIKQGENAIGIMLGDGFQNGKTRVWDFMDNVFNASPRLALTLEIETESGTIKLDASDFKCKKGPVTFNDMRSGVHFDNRLYEKGWDNAGYKEDETWHEPLAVMDLPRGRAKICMAEPVVVKKELKAVSIKKGELCGYKEREDVTEGLYGQTPPVNPPERTGGYIFDFGENNAGIFRLKIKGTPGQRIDIQCAEKLTDGKVDYSNIRFFPDGYSQRSIYILSGEGEEVFEPMFAYFGYRYLYVSGITEKQATDELLTYLVMSSDLDERGGFECSDEIANKICAAAKRSDISNFYYFPTDCPHREKNGWTGDASVSSEHMILTLTAENSWREWLNNIRLAQTDEGELPGIVPTGDWGYEWGNGPAWDSVLFNLPYMTYKYCGETDVIKENAHAMMSYLEYISNKRDDEGIVAIGLGDWVPVDRECDDYEPPLGFTDSLMVLDMCRKAEVMFNAAKLFLNSAYAKNLGDQMYSAIRNKYIDFNNMLVCGNCQSSQALAIYFDVFKPAEKAEAFKRLLEIIKQDNESITSGFLGLRVIFHVLSQFGYSDLAYKMITKEDYPSYAYWMLHGKTTLLESFHPLEIYGASENHHFLGDVIQWFMRYPGGINVINSKNVKIKPCFVKKLNHAKAYHILPDGEVSVKWERDGDAIILSVCCPESVKCDIELDSGYIFENEKKSYINGAVKKARVIRKNA